MSEGPRVLTIDIETAPIESYVWDLHDQNISLDQIKTEWSILAYCAKWVGEKKLQYECTGGRGKKKVRDDSKLVAKIWKLLDQADIVIAQNGRRFDIRKINARLVMHGHKPYSPIRIIDTYEIAKSTFGFTSNKLAWMSRHLTQTKKSEHKRFPGFALWLACLEDDPAAWAEMKKYNQIDVISTEELYMVLRPWMRNHPNLAAYSFGDGVTCPKCKSTKLQHRGHETSQQGRYARLKCTSCGGWSRLKQNLIPKEDRARLLVQ